ncbi:MAG: hypothetical protein IJT41_11925 [Clostridia bacterium]|nr:hypothetical protein [Clostridia bacterium]
MTDDCKNTYTFLANWKRMCDFLNQKCGKVCPLSNGTYKGCRVVLMEDPRRAISVVQAWSDEHPLPKPKTYEDELKKLLPASLLYRKNMDGKQEVYLCRQMLFDSEPPYCNGYIVDKVCMKCWNEPYPQQGASV